MSESCSTHKGNKLKCMGHFKATAHFGDAGLYVAGQRIL
jgi:hypothetical protein